MILGQFNGNRGGGGCCWMWPEQLFMNRGGLDTRGKGVFALPLIWLQRSWVNLTWGGPVRGIALCDTHRGIGLVSTTN